VVDLTLASDVPVAVEARPVEQSFRDRSSARAVATEEKVSELEQ
jgi:hypothetical protein